MRELYFTKNPPLHPSMEGTNSFTTLEIFHLEEDPVAGPTWSIFIMSLSHRHVEFYPINSSLSIQ
jgi:hypothetical protein